MPTKTKYRFLHRGNDNRYYWEARIPGDSRSLVVHCDVDWFWGAR